MKVLVISGFLGAGKTTFIKELSKRTKKEIAILENEYGAVGIDGDLLKEASSDKVNIWEMTEGCICCSVKGDFAASILTIANAVNPEYLVIEPTGVGMLSNVINHIKKVEYERISILAPITIVDGFSIDRYKNEFPDIYENQVKHAKTIIISKMEQANENELNKVGNSLSILNPDADIITTHYTNMDDNWWNTLINTNFDGTITKEEIISDTVFDTFALSNVIMDRPEYLILFLENLIRMEYGNIIRAKGNFRAGKQNLKFDVADGKYSILLSDEEITSKVVFIGTDIKRHLIRKNFYQTSKHVKIHK